MSEIAAEAIIHAPTVCVDFKNPKAYLALNGTFALEDELGFEFDWMPLVVAALTGPRAPQSGDDRGARHRQARARYNEMDLLRYAHAQGLTLSDPYRDPDVTIASIGLLWTKRRLPSAVRRYVRAVFDRSWSAQLDIEDGAAIRSLLRELGVDCAGWDEYVAGRGRTELDETCASLRAAGLFDVPAYVVERQIYLGRQHLPMIRWVLTGRQGVRPSDARGGARLRRPALRPV